MADIFICYRREDSQDCARNLWNILREEFRKDPDGDELVFLDVADRIVRAPWPIELMKELDAASVVLVVIGPDWLGRKVDRKPRIGDKNDWVRKEIEFAVQKSKYVIPVLVKDAKKPKVGDLPRGMRKLLEHEEETVREKTYEDDVERIIKRIICWGLPKNSHSLNNSLIHPAETKERIVCRYELTGLVEAMAEVEKEWRGQVTFETIAPSLAQQTCALFERSLFNATCEMSWHSLPDGAIFFITPPAANRYMEALTEVAKAAQQVVRDYVSIIKDFAEHNPSGLNWVVDVRAVITYGNVSIVKVRDRATAKISNIFSGMPLYNGALLMGHRDRRGRACVRRGDVVVLTGMRSLKNIGFARHDILEEAWSREAPARDTNMELWLARRPPDTSQHFRIKKAIVDTLKERTLTTDEKTKDLLRHVPPSNYSNIAERAKTKERFCIIVGKAGTGKTLCGLRLVAEMMHIDGLDVSIPPVTSETWNILISEYNANLVVFLDDAFGRTQLLDKPELDLALHTLTKGLSDAETAVSHDIGKHTEAELSFLQRRRDRRPALIITVRQDIWDTACEDLAWKKALGQYAVVIDEGAYREDDRLNLFENYWRTPKGLSLPVNEALRESVQSNITHPLSIRDFARECADLRYEEALGAIARYRTDALTRYLKDLESDKDGAALLWHFLTWTFDGGLLNKKDLKILYCALARQLGPHTGNAAKIWNVHEKKQHWGKWEDNGYFTPAHPLRVEAVEKFFRDDQRHDLIERFFEAFLVKPKLHENHDNLELAALAAPKITGKMGPNRQKVIDSVIASVGTQPNDPAARVLASSIGRAFRNAVMAPTAPQDSKTRLVLIQALESLLASADNSAFGSAFAALCDSFPSIDGIPEDLQTATEIALEQLRAACSLRRVGVVVKTAARRNKIQNVEHSAWAIASNYLRVPQAFRDQLAAIVEREGDDWLRLRALEATADYITVMKDYVDDDPSGSASSDGSANTNDFAKSIIDATEPDQPDIMRRGVAGAIEANFDDLQFENSKSAAEKILEWLESSNERYNYGFLEWVIWAAGEHLEHYRSTEQDLDIRDRFTAAIQKLARHEDSRVRRWLATALAESDTTPKDHMLRAIMAQLARDNDGLVRDVAVNFFFESMLC